MGTRQRLRLLTFGLAVGCASREAEPAPAPTPVPAAPETTPAAPTPAKPDGEIVRLSDAATHIIAPHDYVPLADHERERLRLGSTRSNPRAVVEIEGRKSSSGFNRGMTVAMRVVIDDLPSVYGASVQGSLDIMRSEALTQFRTLAPDATVRLEPQPDGKWIELHGEIPVPGRGKMLTRTRHFATPDAFYQVGCQCAGPGCAYGDQGCVLAEPPANALAIDEPILAGQPPVTLTIADGQASVDHAPFFENVTDTELDGFVEGTKRDNPRIGDIQMVAKVGPRNDTGILIMTEATWCDAKDACTVEGVLSDSVDLAIAQTRRDGIEPETRYGMTVTHGKEVREYELRAGMLSWERHVFWAEGETVRELSCMCAQPACPLVERTCRLQPDIGPAESDPS